MFAVTLFIFAILMICFILTEFLDIYPQLKYYAVKKWRICFLFISIGCFTLFLLYYGHLGILTYTEVELLIVPLLAFVIFTAFSLGRTLLYFCLNRFIFNDQHSLEP